LTDSARNAAASCRVVTTTFRHTKDPTPQDVRDWTWGEFVEFIEANGHERTDDKSEQALFGPFDLKPGKTRAKKNVERVFGWALDLDKLSDVEAFDVFARLAADDLAFLVYSTHSHTDAKPKYRALGPLARPVASKDWPQTWRAIVDKYSPGADEACKDCSRIFHWPSARPGAPTVLFSNEGQALEPPAVKASPATPGAPVVDLDAKDVIDAGQKVPRCAKGGSAFEHAEWLCRTMPASVEGQGGSVALLRMARALVWGLELDADMSEGLIGEIFNPRCTPTWTEAEIAHKVSDAAQETGAPYVRGALTPLPAEDFDGLSPIVQSNGRHWVRMPHSDDYSRRCAKEDLALVVRKHWPAGTHEMYVDGDDMPKLTDLAKYSEPVNTIVSCYYAPKTTYDPETEILTQGLRIDGEIKPKFDPDVEAFLLAYGGDNVDDLKRWISACRADRLCAPSRALAIVGKKGLGKSLFAHALARCWGTDAVPANVLCARFNGALEFCPIVLADERLPEELTGEAFRNVIQARTHSIEPKGKERHGLMGCIRMVVTANDLNKLHLIGGKGADDVDAIADRFFLVHVPESRAQLCYDAQKPLLGKDGSTIDIVRMAAHFRHIQDTVEPAPGRFIGSTSDGGARAVTLAAETDRAPEVFDMVRAFLLESWGAAYKPMAAGIPRKGEVVPEAKRNAPFVVQDARMFARVPVIGQLVGREQREVQNALRPFVLGKRTTCKLGGVTLDVHELDPFALAESLELDADRVVETMVTDTADRMTA
jgi:uncharacterized protein DUF5906